LQTSRNSTGDESDDIRFINNDLRYCGEQPGSSSTADGHGIYFQGGTGNRVAGNIIYHSGEQCVKLRGDVDDAVIEDNICHNAGRQVFFNSYEAFVPENNVVRNNIISFPRISYNVYHNWSQAPANSSNQVTQNCLYSTLSSFNSYSGLASPQVGWTAANNTVGDPRYVQANPEATGDFSLQSGSLCHAVYSGRTRADLN
jgi:hypothetical protein